MKFTSSQPSRAHCNSTIIYFYQREQNLTQFVKVLLVKLSDMLHLSNFIRLFHRQSFALYGNKTNKSHNHTSTLFITCLLQKWNFVFTLRKNWSAKTKAAGPIAPALYHVASYNHHLKYSYTIWVIIFED